MSAILISILLLGHCGAKDAPPLTPANECVAPLPGDTQEFPGPERFWNKAGLVISPARILAQVGREVPMFAAVCDGKGHLQPYERVEWLLDQGSVGSFVSVADPIRPFYIDMVSSKPQEDRQQLRGRRDAAEKCDSDPRHAEHQRRHGDAPRLYVGDGDFAARRRELHHRLRTGRLFVGCAAEIGGDSLDRRRLGVSGPGVRGARRTCHADDLRDAAHHGCTGGRLDCEIHDRGRCAGRVCAGQSTNGRDGHERQGQSTVEVVPTSGGRGTTCVTMELIRAECGGSNERLSVATAATSVTWTNTQATMRVIGPSTATVGSTANYRVEVNNPGPLPVSDVTVSLQIPAGLAYVKAEPAPEGSGAPTAFKFASDRRGRDEGNFARFSRRNRPGR